MRYLAININDKLDQNWYFRCTSVLECYNYFDKLGPGHGPRAAIFDIAMNKYFWINGAQKENMERLNGIVYSAVKEVKVKI